MKRIFFFWRRKIKRNLIVRDTHTNTLATSSTANRSLNSVINPFLLVITLQTLSVRLA